LGKGLSQYEQNRIGITQDLDFPLKYKWRRDLAQRRLEVAKFEGMSLLLDLEMEVKKSYLSAWSATEKNKIYEDYFTELQAWTSKIEGMEKLGYVSKYDAKQMVGELKDVECELNNSILAQRISLSNLAQIINVSSEDLELVSPLTDMETDTVRENEKFDFSKSPEYQTADASVKSASNSYFIQARAWLPDFEFFYFQEYRRFDNDPDTWGIQLEISLPLWYFLVGNREVDISRAELNRTLAELEAQRLQSASVWSELYGKYTSALNKYNLYERELIPLDEQSYYRAKTEFDMGKIDIKEIIRTLKRWQRTKIDSLETAVEMLECKIEMERLEGKSERKDF
jgi:outer membrane protein TolC